MMDDIAFVEMHGSDHGAAMTALVQEAKVLAIASGVLPRQITLLPEGGLKKDYA